MSLLTKSLISMVFFLSLTSIEGCSTASKSHSGKGSDTKADPGDPTVAKKDPANGGTTPVSPAPAPAPAEAKDGFGCLQGVVEDGFTGQRVDLSKVTGSNGLYVLIRGAKLKAEIIGDDPNLMGEYHICGIPVEDTYPVFAYIDGYMPFESSVVVDSTRALRVTGDQAVTNEVKIPDPLELQNIRLFPLGNTTRDLRVRVVYNGSPVKDALVALEAKAAGASGTFAFEGTLVNSAGTRILPTRVSTDDEGYATFPAAKLSLGAAYGINVFPPIDSNFSSPGHADIVLGVSGASAGDFNSYEVSVALASQNQPLKAISCSTQFQSYNGSGSIKIMLNRAAIVLDPDGLDISTATGAAGDSAKLSAADIVSTGGGTVTFLGETANDAKVAGLTASVSGNILTITPRFNNNEGPKALNPAADPNDTAVNSHNKDAKISFNFAKFKLDTVGDEKVNVTTLDSLVAGMVPACTPDVRFFQEIQ